MRVKKNRDFSSVSRESMKKDFVNPIIVQEKKPQPKEEKKKEGQRIIEINTNCSYAKLARFLVGKLVKCIEKKEDSTSGWYEFIFDDDRKALNRAGYWSDNKNRYFLERPKFK